MKTSLRHLILFIISLTLGCWLMMNATHSQRIASAQDNELDTVLAEMTLESFLTSLTLKTSNKAKLANFYLTNEIAQDEIVQTLINDGIVDYEIVEA
jgi:hypothetical protein